MPVTTGEVEDQSGLEQKQQVESAKMCLSQSPVLSCFSAIVLSPFFLVHL